MGRPSKPVDETTYAGRFAARLRRLRENAGMTGEQLAQAITDSGYNCPVRTYYGWEAAKNETPLNAVPFIASSLGTNPRTIFPSK